MRVLKTAVSVLVITEAAGCVKLFGGGEQLPLPSIVTAGAAGLAGNGAAGNCGSAGQAGARNGGQAGSVNVGGQAGDPSTDDNSQVGEAGAGGDDTSAQIDEQAGQAGAGNGGESGALGGPTCSIRSVGVKPRPRCDQ